jgi:methylmalonyl-CoA mutase cobalamin-binding subunit
MSQTLEHLLSEAARIGTETRATIDAAKAIMDRAKIRAADTARDVADRDYEAKGFTAPRFNGLVQIAGLYGQAFNTIDSQDARDAAKAMASSFVQTFTGQTEKSAGGGKSAGYTHVVTMGANAKRAQQALQQRLDYWRGEHDAIIDGEPPKDAAERKAKARRYLTTCGDAPDVEGGTTITSSKGEVKVPKFNGRPSVLVHGVQIAYGRGTDRDAQFAAFARLYAEHGDKVLVPDVVDAFLDNGGRFKADSEATLESAAGAALAAIDQIMAMGGASSGDAGFLTAAHTVIERIAKQGFKASQVAAPAQPEPEAPNEQAPNEQAPAESVEDVLAGVGTPPAETAPEAPAEGEGVVLGAPSASRPKRNRNKGKEVQAGA